MFEIERRGYMASGAFVPEVALDHPEALANLHREFQHAGSDVVQAFTYNGHREKMRVLGKEELLEPLNRAALRIAREVADSPSEGPPNLLAGNISNTNVWDPADAAKQRETREMFDEMVGWAKEEGADFIVGETFYFAGEAMAAAGVDSRGGFAGGGDAGSDARRRNARRPLAGGNLQAAGGRRRGRCGAELLSRAGDDDADFARGAQGAVGARCGAAGDFSHDAGASDLFQFAGRKQLRLPLAARPPVSHGAGSAALQPL